MITTDEDRPHCRSATMASESAVLEIPVIYLDDYGRGYTDDLELRYNLVYNFTESNEDQKLSIEKGIDLLQNKNLKKEAGIKREKLLNEKIDVSGFLIDFVENFITE